MATTARLSQTGKRLVCAILSAIFLLAPAYLDARSAMSPRHSGMEAPGGPRQVESMPGRGMSRTPSGGMGYVDAYGNSIDDSVPQEKERPKRLRPGAYGNKPEEKAKLPDITHTGRPLWQFH